MDIFERVDLMRTGRSGAWLVFRSRGTDMARKEGKWLSRRPQERQKIGSFASVLAVSDDSPSQSLTIPRIPPRTTPSS